MLTEDQRKAIEAEAATRLKAEWGHINPRALGDVVADIRARIEDGSWGQHSFAEQLDAISRRAYERAVYGRDDAAFEHHERGIEPGD